MDTPHMYMTVLDKVNSWSLHMTVCRSIDVELKKKHKAYSTCLNMPFD